MSSLNQTALELTQNIILKKGKELSKLQSFWSFLYLVQKKENNKNNVKKLLTRSSLA